MKKLFVLMICLTFAGIVAAQQLPPDSNRQSKPVTIRICTPRRSALLASQPLMVIHARQDTYMTTGNTGLSSINPDWIETINILRDSAAVKSYGDAAKSGVVEVTLKDQYYPKAYELLKELLKQNKIRKLK